VIEAAHLEYSPTLRREGFNIIPETGVCLCKGQPIFNGRVLKRRFELRIKTDVLCICGTQIIYGIVPG
jgi:hypothetical protein